MELRANGERSVTLGTITPNAMTRAAYKAILDRTVNAMAKSYVFWLERLYARVMEEAQKTGKVIDPATYAHDAVKGPKKTIDGLYVELSRLNNYWQEHFSRVAWDASQRIAKAWVRDNTTAWQAKLKRSGFAVKMQMTAKQRTFLQVKVRENVDLIKSIQKQYHTDVAGIVSRGVLAGRDLARISEGLTKHHGVALRRAALIARDQANKATAQLNATRQAELGIRWAIWVHSSAGVEPRKNHVRAGREYWIYDTQVGIDFGDGFGFVQPGEAINCRCSGRSIIVSIGRGLPDGRTFDPEKLVPVSGFPGAYKMAA